MSARRLLVAIAGLVVGACTGGGGPQAPGPMASACPSGSAASGSACVPFASRQTLRASTPFVESGAAVTLEVVLFTPLAPGPHPVVVFHHGSTGNGDDPAAFGRTYVSEPVAGFFAAHGWAVAFPQRRGRGTSGGLYDEGFEPDRSRYSCRQGPAFAGLERALADADAALEFVRALPGIDASRILLAGHSRGGLLAVVQAGRAPAAVRGAVNFVGGWLGEACQDAVLVNTASFARGALSPRPSLWLYARGDPFYGIEHSRRNFDTFLGAGGRGEFHVFERAPGANGHFLPDDPALWGAELDAWLARAGG